MADLPVTLCWYCDRPLDAATELEGLADQRPTPGAISLCLYCGALAVFGPDLMLSPLDDKGLDELAEDREFSRSFVRFQWARQRVMIKRQLDALRKGPGPMTDVSNGGDAEQLVRLTLTVCRACLRGEGGECHTPGCAFWMRDAPNVPLPEEPRWQFDQDECGISCGCASGNCLLRP